MHEIQTYYLQETKMILVFLKLEIIFGELSNCVLFFFKEFPIAPNMVRSFNFAIIIKLFACFLAYFLFLYRFILLILCRHIYRSSNYYNSNTCHYFSLNDDSKM